MLNSPSQLPSPSSSPSPFWANPPQLPSPRTRSPFQSSSAPAHLGPGQFLSVNTIPASRPATPYPELHTPEPQFSGSGLVRSVSNNLPPTPPPDHRVWWEAKSPEAKKFRSRVPSPLRYPRPGMTVEASLPPELRAIVPPAKDPDILTGPLLSVPVTQSRDSTPSSQERASTPYESEGEREGEQCAGEVQEIDNAPKVKRPPNAFILYRNTPRGRRACFERYFTGGEESLGRSMPLRISKLLEKADVVGHGVQEGEGGLQADNSKALGALWKDLGNQEKRVYYELQEEIKQLHGEANPGYVYRPRPPRTGPNAGGASKSPQRSKATRSYNRSKPYSRHQSTPSSSSGSPSGSPRSLQAGREQTRSSARLTATGKIPVMGLGQACGQEGYKRTIPRAAATLGFNPAGFGQEAALVEKVSNGHPHLTTLDQIDGSGRPWHRSRDAIPIVSAPHNHAEGGDGNGLRPGSQDPLMGGQSSPREVFPNPQFNHGWPNYHYQYEYQPVEDPFITSFLAELYQTNTLDHGAIAAIEDLFHTPYDQPTFHWGTAAHHPEYHCAGPCPPSDSGMVDHTIRFP